MNMKDKEEETQGVHVHCSMTGAKADSFALRSARRSLSSSCQTGSAMKVNQR